MKVRKIGNDYSRSIELTLAILPVKTVKISRHEAILRGMRGDISSPHIDGSDEAWSEIEILVDETAKLARMPMSTHEFQGEFVKRVVQATDACGAAVWGYTKDDRFEIESQIESPGISQLRDQSIGVRTQNIREVASSQQPASLLPRQSDLRLRNVADEVLILQPIVLDERTLAVIETFHKDAVSPIESRNIEQIVSIFGDLLADFYRNRQLRELRNREATWSELEDFIERIHQSIDLKSVAFTIANEAVRVLKCDRVTVFHHLDARCRTLAISGLDTFDRRATQVRTAERLALAATATGEPLWHSDQGDPLPPQLEKYLQSHLDAAHVRSLVVVPLEKHRDDERPTSVGVVLLERFENTPWSDSQRRRIEVVCRHAAMALRNANTLASLPLMGISRMVQKCLLPFSARNFPKTAALTVVFAAFILASIFVHADFDIQGEGQLMPTRYRHIFAPADGVIEEVRVHHAASVMEGTTLFEMRRSDLEVDEARLLGEILTNQKRLHSVQSALLSHRPGSANSSTDIHEFTSEEARLKILLDSLHNQQQILKRERAELIIASPIDGEVITWGIEDELTRRPVRRGERLLSVADPNGPWQIELRILDRDIEHVINARRELEDLDVSFIMTSHTGQEFYGSVQDIAMATELDEHDRPTVLVHVALDSEQIPDLRPGARVVANVHCGRRSIGYVWLRELFDVINTRLLF